MSSLKKILFLLILGMLVLPLVQQQTGLIRSAPLKGYFEHPTPPVFSVSSFFNGTFQPAYAESINDSIGFRPDFVRLFNQLDFSLFSSTHAAKIIVGKKGYLYSDEYINAWLGRDYIGDRLIREKTARLKFIQDLLWEKHHILLVVVFPPDKGTFYPEYIPERYLKDKKSKNNSTAFSEELKKRGVNLIDFNPWFLAMKDTSEYILYPKTGIHWSNYGAWLAADSLSDYISEKLNRKMPRIILDSLPVSDILKEPDDDISKTLNMIWPASHPAMAYPYFHTDKTGIQRKVKALFIGDSFYWNLFYTGYIAGSFAAPSFWYYNEDIYPGLSGSPVNIGKINPVDSVLKQDVIVLLQVNGGYGNLGYGFADQMYFTFNPDDEMIRSVEQKMRSNPKWMEELTQKAKERNITLDEMIRNDAIYMINQQFNKNKENKKP